MGKVVVEKVEGKFVLITCPEIHCYVRSIFKSVCNSFILL